MKAGWTKSMSNFQVGEAVSHETYGAGTITGSRIGGYELRVDFGVASIWVPAKELYRPGMDEDVVEPAAAPDAGSRRTSFDAIMRLLTGSAEQPRRSVGPVYRELPDRRPIEAAMAVEAFRLGIVPSASIGEWTVGRADEIAALTTFLHDHSEGAALVEGAYGAGKSHLLQFLANEASSMGFAVATAGFDPSEASAAFPKKAYRHLVQGFRAVVDGRVLDFRGFWKEVATRPTWRATLGDHWLFSKVLERLSAGVELPDADWEFLEARGAGKIGRKKTLYDYSTCANIYCNILSAAARAASEVLGMTGLLVLLDEAEIAGNVMYRYQAQRGMNFFRGLVMTSNDDDILVDEDLVRRETLVGEKSGLIYSAHHPVRYTTGIPTSLKVAFALTPGTLQDEFSRARDTITRVQVDVLTMAQLRDLFKKICATYSVTYGVRLDNAKRDRLFRLLYTTDRIQSTRTFIKAVIEALDYVRFYPGGNVEEMVLEGGEVDLS